MGIFTRKLRAVDVLQVFKYNGKFKPEHCSIILCRAYDHNYTNLSKTIIWWSLSFSFKISNLNLFSCRISKKKNVIHSRYNVSCSQHKHIKPWTLYERYTGLFWALQILHACLNFKCLRVFCFILRSWDKLACRIWHCCCSLCLYSQQ